MAESLTKNKKIIGREIRLGKKIGSGGFGEVYMAEPLCPEGHFTYPSTFVVKIIRKDVCTPDYLDMIHRELHTIKRLHHQFIVDYIGSWVEIGRYSTFTGCYCLATRFCNGGDLHSFVYDYAVKKEFVPEELVVQLLVQVFSAINFLHANKVIHRDIKPGNIFIDKTPSGSVEKAVVGDFGLARPLDQTCQLVATRIGTPSYVSPEIVDGKAYTYKTDVFSAGATFFELMALERPFWRKDYKEKHIQDAIKRHDPIPRLFQRCGQVYDKNILRIIDACLAKQEKNRPTAFDVLCTFSSKLTRYIKANNIVVYSRSSSSPVFVTTPKERASPLDKLRRSPSPAAAPPQLRPASPQPEPEDAARAPTTGDVTDGQELAALLMSHCPSDEDANLLVLLDNDHELFALVKTLTITRKENLASMENGVFKLLFTLKPTVQIQKAVELLSQKFGSRPCEG